MSDRLTDYPDGRALDKATLEMAHNHGQTLSVRANMVKHSCVIFEDWGQLSTCLEDAL